MIYAVILISIVLMTTMLSYVLGYKLRVEGEPVLPDYLPNNRALYLVLSCLVIGLPCVIFVMFLRWETTVGIINFSEKVLFGKSLDELDLLHNWLYSVTIVGNKLADLPNYEKEFLLHLQKQTEYYYNVVGIVGALSVLSIMLLVIAISIFRLKKGLKAQKHSEKIVARLLRLSSFISVMTAFLIVFSMVFETWRFFLYVDVIDFLLGLNWEPQIAFNEAKHTKGAFGLLPVLWGTLSISIIAMIVSVPIGLLSSIYLNGYASKRTRLFIKPILELLAGIPTIVYGFVAVLFVAPLFHDLGNMLGFVSEPNNALAAGVVMGVMIIPFISSFSDDAMGEVPSPLKYGSYALGATRAETILRIMLPSAFPGVASGVLLATSRAIGETMIVVMAAGLVARFTLSPFEGVTTITVQIVAMLVGDTSFDGPKTLSAFSLGMTLFLITLVLNLIALIIVKKSRRA